MKSLAKARIFVSSVVALGLTACADMRQANRNAYELGHIQANATLRGPASGANDPENLLSIQLRRYEVKDDPINQLVPRSVDPLTVDSPTYYEYVQALGPDYCPASVVTNADCTPVPVRRVPLTDSHIIPAENFASVMHLGQLTQEGENYLLSFLDFQRFARGSGDIIRIVSPTEGYFTFSHLLHASLPITEDWQDVYIGLKVTRFSRPNSQEAWNSTKARNLSNDPRYLEKSMAMKVREEGKWDAVINPPNPKCSRAKFNVALPPEDGGPTGDGFSINPYANIDCHTSTGVNGPFMQCGMHTRTFLSAEKNDMVVISISYGQTFSDLGDECLVSGGEYSTIPFFMSDCKENCPKVELPPIIEPDPGPGPGDGDDDIGGGGPVVGEPECNTQDISAETKAVETHASKLRKATLKTVRTFVKATKETGKQRKKAKELLAKAKTISSSLVSLEQAFPSSITKCAAETPRCALNDLSSPVETLKADAEELINIQKLAQKGIRRSFEFTRYNSIPGLKEVLNKELKKELASTTKTKESLLLEVERLPRFGFTCN